MRSKLTETTQATLRAALEAGNTRAAAAQGAGITYECLRLWMRKGEKQGSSAAAENTTVRIIYDAEVAKDLKPWTRSNNGGTHDDRRTL